MTTPASSATIPGRAHFHGNGMGAGAAASCRIDSMTVAAKPEEGRSVSCSRRTLSRLSGSLVMAGILSQLRKALPKQIAATRKPCFHRTLGQAHGRGSGRQIHFVEVIEDQRLAIFVRQGIDGAADGLVARLAVELGVVDERAGGFGDLIQRKVDRWNPLELGAVDVGGYGE